MPPKGTKPKLPKEQQATQANAKRKPGNAGAFAQRERDALEALGAVPASANPPVGPQDTVKLSTQTWQPPPRKAVVEKLKPESWDSAQATVKITSETLRGGPPHRPAPSLPHSPKDDEDAVTDIRDIPSELDDVVVTGEASPEVAGEIGSEDDQPVRIISVPPVEPSASASVRLPGVTNPSPGRPAAQGAAPAHPEGSPIQSHPQSVSSTNRSPVVPMPASAAMSAPTARMPSPRAPTPPGPRQAPAQRSMTPTPLPEVPAERSMTPTPLPEARPPFAENTPFPENTPLPGRQVPRRMVDPTMMIRIQKRPIRGFVLTGVVCAAMGLAVGYGIWGLGNAPSSADAQAAETPNTSSNATATKPVAATESSCKLRIESTPSSARVAIKGEKLGETPLDADVSCGPNEIALAKKQYESATHRVVTKPGAPNVVKLELVRPTYQVTIKSTPSKAEVKLGDKLMGKTPLKLKLDGYTKTKVVLSLDGFRDQTVNLTPRKKRSTVSYKLKRSAK